MLKLIVCIVVEACFAVWFAAYAPRAFLKALTDLENGAEDEKNKKTWNAVARCRQETSKLALNLTLCAGLCVVLLYLDGLRNDNVFSFLFLLFFLCVWILTLQLRKYTESKMEKYVREAGKVDELYQRGQDGLFGERWLCACFVVPYFTLLYQGFTLLFA